MLQDCVLYKGIWLALQLLMCTTCAIAASDEVTRDVLIAAVMFTCSNCLPDITWSYQSDPIWVLTNPIEPGRSSGHTILMKLCLSPDLRWEDLIHYSTLVVLMLKALFGIVKRNGKQGKIINKEMMKTKPNKKLNQNKKCYSIHLKMMVCLTIQ